MDIRLVVRRFILVCSIVLAPLSAAYAATPAYAASAIVVPRDFPTIQAAVDAAAPGDIIKVQGGIYTEEIVISKDVTLKGAGVDATIIQSPATLTPYASDVRNGTPLTAIVRVAHGAHARISALTISGPVPCGFAGGIVAVQAATLELVDARVTDIRPVSAACSFAINRAVQFGLGDRATIEGQLGTSANGSVTNVLIDGYETEGVVAVAPFSGPPTSVTFTDNVITAGDPLLPVEQFGIDVFLNAVANITGNTISGGVCTLPGCGPDPINEFQAMGISVVLLGSGTKIADNHISGADVGIYQVFAENCCTISQNTLTNNRYFGIVIQDGNGATDHNTIKGGQVGIGVVAHAIDTVGTLTGDKITKTSVMPVQEIECCGATATAIVNAH